MEAQEIMKAIANGDVDDQIKVLFTALQERSKYVRAQATLRNQAELSPGTRVVTKGLRPQYLNGLTGTVSARPARRRGDLTILIDEGQYTGSYGNRSNSNGQTLGVPAGALTRLEGE